MDSLTTNGTKVSLSNWNWSGGGALIRRAIMSGQALDSVMHNLFACSSDHKGATNAVLQLLELEPPLRSRLQ